MRLAGPVCICVVLLVTASTVQAQRGAGQTRPGTGTAQDGLSAIIIGSGAPRFNDTRSRPSVLVRYGESVVLVDMGLGTERRLNEEGIGPGRLTALFLTHHHIDHDAELPALLVESRVRGGGGRIVGPPGTERYVRFLLDFYAEDMAYRSRQTGQTLTALQNVDVTDVEGGERLSVGGLTVRTARVEHSIHTVAYRFDSPEASIVVSGDLTYSESLIELATGADLLIIDSGGLGAGAGRGNRSGGRGGRGARGRGRRSADAEPGHASLEEVADMARKAGVKQLVLTHIGVPDLDEEAVLERVGRIFAGTTMIASDGRELMVAEPAPAAAADIVAEPSAMRAPGWRLNDTGQKACYDDRREIACPAAGQPFHGQDAQHGPNTMTFADNGDGTVSDLNTGLMWVKAQGRRVTWEDAVSGASSLQVGGYDDWRLPTIKELYSLIDFSGRFGRTAQESGPYLDTTAFEFSYGDESAGERFIDVQFWSATEYAGTTMGGNPTVFGVNFADGRIKGYPRVRPGGAPGTAFVRYVRSTPGYGANDFENAGDGTIVDHGSGLIWQQGDSGSPSDWEAALAYCESLSLAGQTDWRLPDAKELQSIVDYTRTPSRGGEPAIDPVFDVSEAESYYWASTTALEGPADAQGSSAVYIAFGRALGWMRIPPGSSTPRLMDVHGAGAQRSDPKAGDPDRYPDGRGPQGDVVRIQNYARCVRGSGGAR